jgi:hypothetical protein
VRAGLVAAPKRWPWSSAAVHCGVTVPHPMLAMERWSTRWTAAGWREYLGEGESQANLTALRRSTHTGRPLGTPDFVATLEKATLRLLAPKKGGRPKKPLPDFKQSNLTFVA